MKEAAQSGDTIGGHIALGTAAPFALVDVVHKSRLLDLGARKPHLLTTFDAIWLSVQRLRPDPTKINHCVCPSVWQAAFLDDILFRLALDAFAVLASVDCEFRAGTDPPHRSHANQRVGAYLARPPGLRPHL